MTHRVNRRLEGANVQFDCAPQCNPNGSGAFAFDPEAGHPYTSRRMKKKTRPSAIQALLIWCAFSLVSILALRAHADTVRGFIRSQADGTVFIEVDPSQPKYRIVASNSTMTVDLMALKVGDYVIARGSLSPGDQTAHLDSIESLGLQEILGSWQADSERVFEFKDFTRLNLYRSLHDSSGTTLAKTKQFDYVIAPDSGARYSIFLSDNTSVHVGSVEFLSDTVQLTILDPKTGSVAENISLSPLTVK